MNKISIWSKFKNYIDWAYQYRIPTIDEFVDGFEYEFLSFMITKPTSDKFTNEIEVYYSKRIFGREQSNKSLQEIKTYLEAGYIRVPLDETLIYVKVNKPNGSMQQEISYPHISKRQYWQYLLDSKKGYDIEYSFTEIKQPMKLFYYKVDEWQLKRNTNKEIIQYTHDYTENPKFLYVITKAESSIKGEEYLENTYRINLPNSKQSHKLLEFDGKEGYIIESIGKELTKEEFNNIKCSIDQVFVTPNAMHDFSELWPKSNEINAGIMKAEQKEKVSESTKIHPRLNVLSKIQSKIKEILHKTPITYNEIKVESSRNRIDLHVPMISKGSGVKQESQDIITKDNKSLLPNRLVYIATKDRTQYKRCTWEAANEIIKLDADWEFVTKTEGRRLKVKLGGQKHFRPIPGNAFTTPLSGRQLPNISKFKGYQTEIHKVGKKDDKGKPKPTGKVIKNFKPSPVYNKQKQSEKVTKPVFEGRKHKVTTIVTLPVELQYNVTDYDEKGKPIKKLVTEITRYSYNYSPLKNENKKKSNWKHPIRNKK